MIALVDTCVWSLALRRAKTDLNPQQQQTIKALQEMIVEGRVRLLGVVRQELLSGIRHKAQFDRVATALRTFEDVELEIPDYEEAAVADNRCRSAGLTGSTTDFLICATAIRRNWGIFTTDQDFARYEKVLLLTLVAI
jgi:predicted nucleic acid-binding protein